jgi:hypothetical protein
MKLMPLVAMVARQVAVDVHVNQCVAMIVRWKGKQLVIIQGLADHKVDC